MAARNTRPLPSMGAAALLGAACAGHAGQRHSPPASIDPPVVAVWHEIELDGRVIAGDVSRARLIDEIAPAVHSAHEELTRWAEDTLGAQTPPSRGLRLHIYVDPDRYAREVDAGGSHGLAADGILALRWADGEAARTLRHELAHWLIEERLAGLQLPAWLEEGLATLAEAPRADPSNPRPRLQAAASRILRSANADEQLRTLGHKAHADLAPDDYALAWWITRWLAERGSTQLRRVLHTLGDWNRIERTPRLAVELVLGRPMDETETRHHLMRPLSYRR